MNLKDVGTEFFKTGVFVSADKIMPTVLLQTSFWKDL